MKYVFLMLGLFFMDIGFGIVRDLIYDDGITSIVVITWIASLLFKVGGTFLLGTVGNIWGKDD